MTATIRPARDPDWTHAAHDDEGLLVGCVSIVHGSPAFTGPAACNCGPCNAPRPAVPTRYRAQWAGNLRGIGGLHFSGDLRTNPAEALADLEGALTRVGWLVSSPAPSERA